MAKYVDGFILPVPKKNVEKYRKLAKKAGKLWIKYGALEYFECVADDVKPGKLTSFPQSVKKTPAETVFFSFIIFKSRAHRDKVNKRVMNDKWMEKMGQMGPDFAPFDARRMIYGGFKTVVAIRKK